MATVTECVPTLRALMADAIDYAGLFPPASLGMRAAVGNYARYLRHPQSWALGRFVLPASRLDEFLAQDDLIAEEGETVSAPWRLSAILSSNLAAELAAIQAFYSIRGSAVIDCIEARISQPAEMEFIRRHLPPGTKVFFEIAPERGNELLPFIRLRGFCTKLRTGGVVSEAFPCIDTVAWFLERCAELGVCLKATAGLHHPLRRIAPMNYEANSPKTAMHGFLNFFTAAAIAWCRHRCDTAPEHGQSVPHVEIESCLSDTQAANWRFTDDALIWSGGATPLRIERETILQVRSNFALGFGSCSFEEPIEELRALDFL